MSIDRGDRDEGARASARELLARAAAASGRVDRRLDGAIQDFFLPDDARLDDRVRATLAGTLAAIVDAVERDVRGHAALALGQTAAGEAVADGAPVLDRLIAAGLLRDGELMRELLGRTRQDLLADRMPALPGEDSGAGSLLARLSGSAEPTVARAALALMAADGRRRAFLDTNRLTQSELPAEVHHRLVWWITAAIREQLGTQAADRALADAALRALGSHDESDRVEAAAARLASTIGAQPAELPALLIHALGDRQLALFVALLGHAAGIDYAAARDLVVDGDDRLWLALRAAGLDRATIARIGLTLAEADPRRDVEAFADQLDAIAAVTVDEARAALAPLRLPPDFRAALAALEARR